MINNVVLTGRLTDFPEIKHSKEGTTKICNFSIAVNRIFTQPNQPQADFIRCIALGKVVDVLEKYTTKGTMVGVEGRLQTNSVTNQNGQKTTYTNVLVEKLTLLSTKSESRNHQEYGLDSEQISKHHEQSTQTNVSNEFSKENVPTEKTDLIIEGDDLPF